MSVSSASGTGSRLYPIPLQYLLGEAIFGTYVSVGVALPASVRLIKFMNLTTYDTWLSWDGITDHEYIPAGTGFTIDVSANREVSNILHIAQGTQFFVRGTIGGTGSFYVSAYYAQ